MKRAWALILMMTLLLTGCARKQPEQQNTKTPESGQTESEKLAAEAGELYQTITDSETFRVTVEELDGTETAFDIVRGENDGDVAGRQHTFTDYTWSAASEEDWKALLASQDGGYLLTVASQDGKAAIRCCSESDLAALEQDGKTSYYQAVNPKEGQEPYAWKLYGSLEMIARDAVSHQVWSVTANGALPLAEAAEELAEQVAENYRSIPDWVDWKPLDVRADGANVYDVYLGKPQQFCCSMSLRVKLEDPENEQAAYWQAGAGLDEPDSRGYCGYDSQVYVVKNQDGDWAIRERGTGGYFVQPPVEYEKATAAQLVEVFRLTEGETHDWRVPYYLLALPKAELSKLPAAMDSLTEDEARELCRLLEKNLDRTKETGAWTREDLGTVLGEYSDYLDA